MKGLHAIEGGLAGAVALTLIHETMRRAIPNAPRLDLLGMQALSKTLKSFNKEVPTDRKLYGWSLAGDLVSNGLFYSLSGIGEKKNALAKGAMIGLLGGVAAVVIPKSTDLNENASGRTMETKLLTIGLYVVGGIVAAGVMKLLSRKKRKENDVWHQRLVTSSMA